MHKILFVNDHLNYGGVASVTKRLAHALSNIKDCDVDILLITKDREYNSLNFSKISFFQYPRLVVDLLKYFNENQPNYIVASKDFVAIPVFIALKLSKTKCKLLVNSHTNVLEVLNADKAWPLNKFAIKLGKFFYKYVDIIANVSKAASKNAEEYFGCKVHTLYNPCIKAEDVNKEYTKPKHPFFEDDSNKVILSVGRLSEEKNHRFMLDVFSNALKNDSSLKLIIIGDGKERGELEKYANNLGVSDKVSFLGFNDCPQAYMAYADLFYLTSKYEGFGIVLVEALAVSCNILSVNCNYGPDEILNGGEYGYLVDGYDVRVHTDAVLCALKKGSVASRQKLASRALDFEDTKCAKAYLKALKISK